MRRKEAGVGIFWGEIGGEVWVEKLWQCWERGRSVEVRVKEWMKSRAEEWRRGLYRF